MNICSFTHTQMKLVYVYLNEVNVLPPDTLYKSIHQACLVSRSLHVLILTNRCFIKDLETKLNRLDISSVHTIQIIPIDLLNVQDTLHLSKDIFRDGFWRYTTERFYVIESFIKAFELSNECFFHMENDIVLYTDLDVLSKSLDSNSLYIVKDSPNRGIGSIIYTNTSEWLKFMSFVKQTSNPKLNDMDLLGLYSDSKCFPIFPSGEGVYDGACIGQYLGGIDPRNLNIENVNSRVFFNNPTKGFVNETSIMKPNEYTFVKSVDLGLKKYYIKSQNILEPIHNLHIHSKHLAPFSSCFDLDYNDIISGDRVTGLADVVICTKEILEYHVNLDRFNSNTIIVRDYKSIDQDNLKSILMDMKKEIISIHLYTHTLDQIVEYLLPILQTFSLKYIFYLHNSDHALESKHMDLVLCEKTVCVYAQNVNVELHKKVTLLPIGIANSMFSHGNLLSLYQVMTDTFINKKTKGLFISISKRITHPIRKVLLEKLKNTKHEIQNSLPFEEYLYELSRHYFVLCPRGNGIDTHRFWETLYLGGIPMIINTRDTNCKNFVAYLNDQGIPHYSVTNLDELDTIEFTETLYNDVLKSFKVDYIQNLDLLKMSMYLF